MPKFIKGLLFGTLVGAMATAYLSNKQKIKSSDLVRIGTNLRNKIMKKAAKLSSITKKSYEEVVEKVVDEYQDWKHLSAEEIADLKTTLKSGWKDVSHMFKK